MEMSTANVLQGSTVVAAPEPNQDTALTDWLNLEQDKIDERFNSVTTQQFRQMVIALITGGSPYDVLTDQCPVRRRTTPDGVVASYTATVLVNRSASLEGKYTLVCEGYEVRGPYKQTRQKAGELWTDAKEVIELGWLPISFAARQDWGPNPPLTWEQSNGFFYPSDADHALFWVSGVADVDVWEILVEHQQGNDFPDKKVLAEAYWGENEYELLEVKIPGCVLSAFNQCANTGTGGEYWFELNAKTRYIYYNACTGELLEIRYDDDGNETIKEI
jgi:hypothetical protein